MRFHRPLKRAELTLKKDLSENFCGELKKTRAVAELIGRGLRIARYFSYFRENMPNCSTRLRELFILRNAWTQLTIAV